MEVQKVEDAVEVVAVIINCQITIQIILNGG